MRMLLYYVSTPDVQYQYNRIEQKLICQAPSLIKTVGFLPVNSLASLYIGLTSSKTSFADNDVFFYILLDPERRRRELRRFLLSHQKDYDRFSVKRKGFMVLMSSSKIPSEELVPMYYTRQFVEKAFSYSKDDLSFLPFRVHGENAMRGYLFLIFLYLIVYMDLQKRTESV